MECIEWHIHLVATDCPQSRILSHYTLYIMQESDHQYVVCLQVAGYFTLSSQLVLSCSFFWQQIGGKIFSVILSQPVYFAEAILTHHD